MIFIRNSEKRKAKKQSIHTYIVHSYVSHIPMMLLNIIPCQTFLHITTQWCHMKSEIIHSFSNFFVCHKPMMP